MDNQNKISIENCLAKGMSVADISELTGVSKNTIKSHIRRQKKNDVHVCLNCGNILTMTPHKKQKKFCSDRCRMHYWNTHPQEMNLTNATTIKCEVCGKDVLSYRKKPRRFCSRACAVKGRACHE